MPSDVVKAEKVVRRSALATTIAAAGIAAGTILAPPVQAQLHCPNDVCTPFIFIEICSDGSYNCQCDMQASGCRSYICDTEQSGCS